MRLLELKQGLGLTIFDIDDTLFHTTAEIKVIKNGQIVRSLNNQEFNNYELQPGESFDFGEFRSAEKFNQESKPIRPMIAKLKAMLKNAGDSTVIMLTARADFDDKEKFLSTFEKYGIDMSRVHVHRAGNLPGDDIPAEKKAVWVRRYLDTGKYSTVRLYDDSRTNLTVFKALEQEYPAVKFEAYYVDPRGSAIVHEDLDVEVFEDYDTIDQTLRSAGYTELGSGADASVWTKDAGTVIKIIVPEDEGTLSQAAETFKKFYEFCMQHQKVECLPKFIKIQGSHYAEFEIQGQTYLQIAMEQLYPLTNGSLEEGIVWLFSHYATQNTPWATIDKELATEQGWELYVRDFDNIQARTLASTWAKLNKRKKAELALLYTVMVLLFKTGQINKLGWDLHTENVMKRRDGTLVIIDPWFNTEGGTGS
jgi:hypothetical protein